MFREKSTEVSVIPTTKVRPVGPTAMLWNLK